LEGLPLISDPNLIMGMERSEDAGVYKLRDDLAIIQTVDFFTPIVDDAYTFGQIATVNALSDVYAKGGRPLTALNIVCFPIKAMDISILRETLKGGLSKMREAGVVLVGGHSVEDPELKYGLSVTGVIHPDRVIMNQGAKAGDKLILTKPLGTGIISTALKNGKASDKAVAKSVSSMSALNKKASELMLTVDVHACTDITGFGLLGHACEMIEGTDVGMVIHSGAVPYFTEAKEYAEKRFVPGGTGRNRDFRIKMVDIDKNISKVMVDILFDPQTSGGLLMAVPAADAEPLVKRMRQEGIKEAAIIGEVVAKPKARIIVR
jgi:selenide,water dikinase